MLKVSAQFVFPLIGLCFVSGCHQMSRNSGSTACDGSSLRCDMIGGTTDYSRALPPAAPAPTSPPQEPQRVPQPQNPQQVPPAEQFLPPVKGPAEGPPPAPMTDYYPNPGEYPRATSTSRYLPR